MPREIQEPTLVEREYHRDGEVEESHPAWVMIGASRVQSSPPAVLFDSDIQHTYYVVIKLARATRIRNLNRDWLHGENRSIVEVALSEAQWASFVSSMGVGGGVPATLQWLDGEGQVPGMPYAPRLQESMDEVRNAADQAVAKVAKAFAEVEEAFESNAGRKVLREKIRTLHFAVAHMPANAEFAAKSLTEHAENVVQKSRADIEAMMVAKAHQLGLEPGDLGVGLPQLAPPSDT